MRILLLTLVLLCTLSLRAQPVRRFSPTIDGQHIITFTPICGMTAYGQGNPGVGFDYEYVFNRKAGVGFHLPVVMGYEGPEPGSITGNNDYRHTMVYAAPGIRFHAPFGGRKHAEFVTGPAIVIGNIHYRPYENSYYYNGAPPQPYNDFFTGIAADNSLNIYNRHFVFGFDARVGTTFDARDSKRFFFHLGMHFGGIF